MKSYYTKTNKPQTRGTSLLSFLLLYILLKQLLREVSATQFQSRLRGLLAAGVSSANVADVFKVDDGGDEQMRKQIGVCASVYTRMKSKCEEG